MRKLKHLKEKLKIWNREVFGDIKIRKADIIRGIEELDRIEESRSLSERKTTERPRLRGEFEEVLLREDVSCRQKSRVTWAQEGDCNSKFFHMVVTGRQRRGYIREIELNDGSITKDLRTIVDEITGFYEALYTEELVNRPMIEGLDSSPISEERAQWLERPFEEGEVLSVVSALAGDKASRPDGFAMANFLSCWDIVKRDVMRVFDEFFVNGVVCQSINSTFITLIPKKDRSLGVKDFRPISLVTSCYTIIIEVLSRKLGGVLANTIFESQCAFIGDRQVIDVVLVANELVDDLRHREERSYSST